MPADRNDSDTGGASPGACPVNLDVARLRSAIQAEYAEVALKPSNGFHFHTGRALAALLGYDPAEIRLLPDDAVESFAGVGNPFVWGRLRPGEVVVDVGSGAGLDAIIAARQVGARGRVVGVDMTPAMVAKAVANAAAVGAANVEFREGVAEALPVPDASADAVLSNGVINLCHDKDSVFRELRRVLKPGGRLQLADIVVERPVPKEAKEDVDLWTG